LFRKTVSALMLSLLVISTLTLAFRVQIVKADGGTIYINADGSITPAGAPITTSDNITYMFTGNICYPAYWGIIAERSNIVIDGNGHTVQGDQSGYNWHQGFGLSLTDINNITITNTTIVSFDVGIYLTDSNNSVVCGNSEIDNTDYGIWLDSSFNDIISGNSETNNGFCGIEILYSSNNIVSGNNAVNNQHGIVVAGNSNNIIANNITANSLNGISIAGIGNEIVGNNITENGNGMYGYIGEGMLVEESSNNIYYNNFVDNMYQVLDISRFFPGFTSLINNWDSFYAGNYWSDYTGIDANLDGIGDSPLVIYPNNIDHYPLMNQVQWPPLNITVTSVLPSKTVCYQGSNISVNVTVRNGDFPEEVWVTVYSEISNMSIGTYPACLEIGQSYTFKFNWNTKNVQCQNYTLTAVATIPTGSNALSDGNISVRLVGDVNGDGRIDLRDTALVARALGSTPTSANWNPSADIDGDGVVNMQDITLVARHFGQHYP